MAASPRRLLLVVLAVLIHGQCIAQDTAPPSKEQIDRINAKLKQSQADRAAGRTPPLTDVDKKRINESLAGLHAAVAASQKLLLHQTDHATLASDVRAFAAKQNWGRSAPKETGQVYAGNDSALPASVRALKPTSVGVFEDRVGIECGGALHHHGISVFRKLAGGYGTKNLGNGVWYYSEGDRMFDGPPPKI